MKTASDIIAAFGGASSLARMLNIGATTVSEWGRRGSIPSRYHRNLVSMAEVVGIEGVTADVIDRVCDRDDMLPTAAE